MGIGTEKGNLKLAFSSNITGDSIIDMPNVGRIADGLWHNLLISFLPFYLEIDGNAIMAYENGGWIPSAQIFTDGVFYLGGINDNNTMVVDTNGIFLKPFSGCIDAFGVNGDIITNFSSYEGESIDACDYF